MAVVGKDGRNVGSKGSVEPIHSKEGSEKHPIEAASIFSFVTVNWLSLLISTGSKRPLEFSDLPFVPENVQADTVGELLQSVWLRELEKQRAKGTEKSKVSFLRVLLKTFWKEWVLAGFFLSIYAIATVLSPFVIEALLTFLNERENYDEDPFMGIRSGWGLVVALGGSVFVAALGSNISFLLQSYLGVRVRAAIMYLMFKKSLKLSPTVTSGGSRGEIVNLMANDSERIFFSLLTSHFLWISPILIVVVMAILIINIGLAALAGFGVIVVILALQIHLAQTLGTQKRKMLKITDTRVNLTSETLSGISVVKLNAWEPQMAGRIQEQREKEMSWGKRVLYLLAINTWLLFIAPSLIALAIFSTFVLGDDDGELSIVLVFATLSFLSILRFPLMIIPRAVGALVQALVSMRRIEQFLNLMELECPPGSGSDHDCSNYLISIRNGTFTWEEESKGDPVLKDINLDIKEGELVAIVGSVASGKSSLLSALIGEIRHLEGTVDINLRPKKISAAPNSFHTAIKGKEDFERAGIAFVAQEPWIQNATVRENIVFQAANTITSLHAVGGDEAHLDDVNEDLLKKCIDASELAPDLAILPDGIDTEIGDRGVNLSGGQKSRVSLARALYTAINRNMELAILDDCFSSLDAHVGLKVFEKMLLEHLSGRTRIVVLNSQMHLLNHFDRIIVMEGGRIKLNQPASVALGSPEIQKWLQVTEESEREENQQHEGEADNEARAAESGITMNSQESREETSALIDQRIQSSKTTEEAADENNGILYQQENRERGTLKFGVYRSWLEAAVPPGLRMMTFLACFSFFALGQISRIVSEYWLGVWADEMKPTRVGLSVYAGIIGIMVFFTLARALLFMFVSVRSSIKLHEILLNNVLRAPINLFFDVTPAGRIINRISSDLDKVDNRLPETTFNFLSNLFQVVSIFVLCSVASPFFILFLVPIMTLFIAVGRYFAKSSRELKRMESVSRSPLYSNFGETLAGMSTIRAFALQANVLRKNVHLIDTNDRAFLIFWMAARWLAFRLDLLVTSLQLSVAILAVAVGDALDPSLIALALVYVMQLSGMLQFTVRLAVEVDNFFTSVERLGFLARSIPQERDDASSDPPPLSWPTIGEIEFDHVSMSYRPGLDLVLKEVSFKIKGGESVGIAGRTGAGKSSLTTTLFRIVDPLANGKILIDGMDISKVGLRELRSQLRIIPQNPVIWSGTLRFNVDPWGRHSDESIRNVLKQVELEDLLENGLHMILRDHGANLSVGQRQLISIARAVIAPTKILVMDEATANIDTSTDRIVQNSMRELFADRTRLTIAHRIGTILDSDKILLLESGRVVEFDSPTRLLSDPKSEFAKLAESSLKQQ